MGDAAKQGEGPGAEAVTDEGTEADAEEGTEADAAEAPRRRRRKARKAAVEERSRRDATDLDGVSRDVARRLRGGASAETVAASLLEDGLTVAEIETVFQGAAAILRAENARKDTLHGALWLGGGLLVTLISYSAAEGGGHYVVTTGAIVYGAFRLIRGLSKG